MDMGLASEASAMLETKVAEYVVLTPQQLEQIELKKYIENREAWIEHWNTMIAKEQRKQDAWKSKVVPKQLGFAKPSGSAKSKAPQGKEKKVSVLEDLRMNLEREQAWLQEAKARLILEVRLQPMVQEGGAASEPIAPQS